MLPSCVCKNAKREHCFVGLWQYFYVFLRLRAVYGISNIPQHSAAFELLQSNSLVRWDSVGI